MASIVAEVRPGTRAAWREVTGIFRVGGTTVEARCLVMVLDEVPAGAWSSPPTFSSPDPSAGGLPPHKLSLLRRLVDGGGLDTASVGTLAACAGLSPSHFSRALKEATGMSPHRWLTARKIDRAKIALRRSDRPLADIALEVGFASQQHFCTVFKRMVGMTPGAWRRLAGATDQPDPGRDVVPIRRAG